MRLVDVARRAGVSTAVVSYVLNDGPRPVAPPTKQRVRAAIDELGYRPLSAARTLRTGRSGLLGVLVPDVRVPFFSTLVHTIDAAAFDAGFDAVIASSGWSTVREHDRARALVDAGVEALLVSAATADTDLHDVVAVPLVFVHHRPTGQGGSLVAADDRAAGGTAAAHLVQSGRRHITVVAPPDAVGPVRDRYSGAADLLGAHGLRFSVVEAPFDRSLTKATLRDWYERSSGCDAVLALTDEHALGALAALTAAGCSVPDDVALVTIDGTSETAVTTPAITAVAVPFHALGSAAVRAAAGDEDLEIVLPMELVVRESTLVLRPRTTRPPCGRGCR